MPQGRIQPRTWYVEFGLDVSAAPAFAVDDFELEQPIEECFQIRIRLRANVQFHEDPCEGSFFNLLATCQGLRPLLLLQQHPGLSEANCLTVLM